MNSAAPSRLPLLLAPLRSAVREGGRGAQPCIRAANLEALTGVHLRSSSSSFSCACSPSLDDGANDNANANAPHLLDEFSVLSPVTPWEVDDIWRTYGGYFFILHIPLSFGGLDVVAKVLHCSSLEPMTTVISTLILQLAELVLALALLQYTATPGHDVQAFFAGKVSTQRSWIKQTILGIGFLMVLVWLTTIIADKFVGHEDAYDPILKEILSESPTSKLLCFFLYCVIAPLSEEIIYRGFLLTGLSSSMKWQDAVVISSLTFSAAHLSGTQTSLETWWPRQLIRKGHISSAGVSTAHRPLTMMILALIFLKDSSLWPGSLRVATLKSRRFSSKHPIAAAIEVVAVVLKDVQGVAFDTCDAHFLVTAIDKLEGTLMDAHAPDVFRENDQLEPSERIFSVMPNMLQGVFAPGR